MRENELGRASGAGNVDADSLDSADSFLREAAEVRAPSNAAAWGGPLPGEVLLDRFVIERLAGQGGMGAVYRARDLVTQGAAAVKVMASGSSGETSRFAREALVLGGLSHPAVVRYLAHGTTPRGLRFLAMEWLEGEDLSQRLLRAPLTVEESLVVLRGACEGISVAHARGVVHRDIKPSNLFLVNGDPRCLKVLDFGVARLREDSHTLTVPGALLGTVGYMAPEQATGPRDVDARADVFALGCVLFECLTGCPAFAGRNAVAVLAKVLGQDAPRASELRPGLSPALDALVAHLMAKAPDERPGDAAVVLEALIALGPVGSEPVAPSSPPAGLTSTERKVVSVLIGKPRGALPNRGNTSDAAMAAFRESVKQFGAEPIAMRGGGLLVVFAGRGVATDQATQAARCALLLLRHGPGLCLALATGRAETLTRVPTGAAIDRAAELVLTMDGSAEGVATDELTAGLIGSRFDVRRVGERVGERLWLLGERADPDTGRLLMGKRTPFVGREKELGLLELTLRECIDDSVARAVLVTGPPGQGKSRLRQELLARVRTRDDVRILVARADAVSAGSAFVLARQLIRSAVALGEGDGDAHQYSRLRASVEALGARGNAARIADFLGELVGAPSPAGPGPELRAARNDPQIMRSWLEKSFVEWLEGMSAEKPLLIVLEDLHWGDAPTVAYLREALRSLTASPFMVLALARPEVHEAFPNLWSFAEKHEIALGRLAPRAAERLAREILGGRAADDAVSRIVTRADGNAFYLEELIRRVAEGDSEMLPETVLALVQSRLERLEPEARRVVRAASLYGEVFWGGALAAVLGGEPDEGQLDVWLRILVEREIFVRAHETRFPGQVEYRFRHALVREAASAMLTDADRVQGHWLAGDWLEREGDGDALAIANHFELGGRPVRAIRWLLRAAQATMDGGNIDDSVSIAERGIACGAGGSDRGLLLLAKGYGLAQGGNWSDAAESLQKAIENLPGGSADWSRGVVMLLWCGSFLGATSITTEAQQALEKVVAHPEPSGPHGLATFLAFQGLTRVGQLATARTLLERAEALETSANDDPAFVLWLRTARARLELMDDRLGPALVHAHEARLLADRARSPHGQTYAGLYQLVALSQTGHAGRVDEMARGLIAAAHSRGRGSLTDWVAYFAALTKVVTDDAAVTIVPLRALLDRKDPFLVSGVHAALSLAMLAGGDREAAETEAIESLNGTPLPWNQAVGLKCWALIELASERFDRALALAERGLEAASHGNYPENVSTLRLTRAEALHGLGRRDEARAAITEARDRILRIAAGVDDPELRTSYLSRIRAHVRTLALASVWLREG